MAVGFVWLGADNTNTVLMLNRTDLARAQPNVTLSSHFSPKGEELLLQQLNQLLVLVDGLDGLLQRRVGLSLMVAVTA